MNETVLVYLGPSLDLETAKALLPEAIFLPPARHADLISHVGQYKPTHILLIDSQFGQELPPWHKEICYAALSGIKVYGASSMGALRAAELADFGCMIGVGKIYQWYYEGVLEDDAEVCVLYHRSPSGAYLTDTCPLVNVRAGLLSLLKSGKISLEQSEVEFARQQAVHYADRYSIPAYAIDQKKADAIELLTNFRRYYYITDVRPDPSYLTPLFNGLFERERRVDYKGTLLTLQNVDSYISLHSPQHHQIRWDAQNRALVLILAEIMQVTVTEAEIDGEWASFCARHHLETWEMLEEWLTGNLMSRDEFYVLNIQNARIRKLQRAHVTSSIFERQTKTILSYLRSHDRLTLWVSDCAEMESKIIGIDNAESVDIDLSVSMASLLRDHFDATGLQIDGTIENFVRDCGIGRTDELRVVLERCSLARGLK